MTVMLTAWEEPPTQNVSHHLPINLQKRRVVMHIQHHMVSHHWRRSAGSLLVVNHGKIRLSNFSVFDVVMNKSKEWTWLHTVKDKSQYNIHEYDLVQKLYHAKLTHCKQDSFTN